MIKISEKTKAYVLAFSLVFIPCIWRYEGDVWHSKWAVMLACAVLLLGFILKTSLNSYPAALLFTWTLLSSLWVFAWRDNFYVQFETPVRCTFDLFSPSPELFKTTACTLYQFEANSSYAAFSFLLFAFLLSVTSVKFLRKVACAFAWAGFASSCLVLFRFLQGGMTSLDTGGFFNQGSMEGLFIAVTYPLLSEEEIPYPKKYKIFQSIIVMVLPVLACVVLCWKGEASQPLVLMAIAFHLILFRNIKFNVTLVQKITMVLIGLSIVGIVGKFINPRFLDNNNRFPIYKMAYTFWKQDISFWIFGTGNGSWSVWGPLLQKTTHILEGSTFSWMHSDFGQLIFEQGFLGFILLIATGCHAIVRAYRTPAMKRVAFSILVYGAGMVFQFPFHLPVHAFLGIFLLAFSLRQ